MPTLSPLRRWCALLSLALGGFAIGATEFVAMGLLPNMAADLLPDLYASSGPQGIAKAGWMISAYALGVVVGAPIFALVAARYSRTTLLLGLLVVFIVGTVASALLPSFGLILVARFAAALPHGAYFGTASLVAAAIMGPGSQGKGIAIVLSGLTVSNVVGVPAITYLGQQAGWRVAYFAVAGIFVLTLVAVLLAVPRQRAEPGASARQELRIFRLPQAWLMMAAAAIGFGGFFAVYSYIAEVVTQVAGRPLSFVPWALVAIGLGMTVGNLIGGWAADQNLRRMILVGTPVLILSLLAFALTADNVVGLLVSAFAIGAANGAVIPSIQARLIRISGDAQLIAASLNHSAFNVGNSLGAILGGAVISAGFGYLAPTLVGIGLTVVGFAMLLVSFGMESHQRRGTPGATTPAEPALIASR